MVRAKRTEQQSHSRFIGCAIPLAVIASHTRTHQILPSVATTTRFWKDMVNRERGCWAGAVGAPEIIPAQDILPR